MPIDPRNVGRLSEVVFMNASTLKLSRGPRLAERRRLERPDIWVTFHALGHRVLGEACARACLQQLRSDPVLRRKRVIGLRETTSGADTRQESRVVATGVCFSSAKINFLHALARWPKRHAKAANCLLAAARLTCASP